MCPDQGEDGTYSTPTSTGKKPMPTTNGALEPHFTGPLRSLGETRRGQPDGCETSSLASRVPGLRPFDTLAACHQVCFWR